MKRMYDKKQLEKIIEENSTKLYKHEIYFSTDDAITLIDNSKELINDSNIFSRVREAVKVYVATAEFSEGILLSFMNPETGRYTISYYDQEEGINTLELTDASFEDMEVSPY